MGQITVVLTEERKRKDYIIPKGTKFTVDEDKFNQADKLGIYVSGLEFRGRTHSISSLMLQKITTPLDFATQEEYVILECIESNSEIELGSLHKVRKSTWEAKDKNYLHLAENVKRTGHYYKKRFKIHQPNQEKIVIIPKVEKDPNTTMEVRCICGHNAKTTKGETRVILNGQIHIVNKELWKNKLHIYSDCHCTNGEILLIEPNHFVEHKITLEGLLSEPIKPDEAFKAKEPFYNMIQIKCINPINVQPTIVIPREAIFTVDVKDWDDKLEYIGVLFWGKHYKVPKEHFRSIKAIHEEAGTFPSIPQGIKTNEYGKMVMYGTGGENKEHFTNWFDSPNHIDWGNYYNDNILSYPSRNEPSKRYNTEFQDGLKKMMDNYNAPITPKNYESIRYPYGKSNNVFDHEALEKRIAELKHGKQLVWDEVGISPERLGRNRTEKAMQYAKAYGMSIDKQFELANKTGLLWQTYPDKMRDDEIMKGLIQDNLLADIADSTYTIYTPSRRSGLTWSRKLLDVFMEAYKQSKSSFTNITRTKRPKKKKQHIVESMSNIKL